jgi:hypothetical protein
MIALSASEVHYSRLLSVLYSRHAGRTASALSRCIAWILLCRSCSIPTSDAQSKYALRRARMGARVARSGSAVGYASCSSCHSYAFKISFALIYRISNRYARA